jgi:glyoxylase-like metal-dependent hydrolase (beta-lactamase superfamily II)
MPGADNEMTVAHNSEDRQADPRRRLLDVGDLIDHISNTSVVFCVEARGNFRREIQARQIIRRHQLGAVVTAADGGGQLGRQHRDYSRSRVIDPEVGQIDRYLALAGRDGLRIRFVIDTHTHADHFSGTGSSRDSSMCRW